MNDEQILRDAFEQLLRGFRDGAARSIIILCDNQAEVPGRPGLRLPVVDTDSLALALVRPGSATLFAQVFAAAIEDISGAEEFSRHEGAEVDTQQSHGNRPATDVDDDD